MTLETFLITAILKINLINPIRPGLFSMSSTRGGGGEEILPPSILPLLNAFNWDETW